MFSLGGKGILGEGLKEDAKRGCSWRLVGSEQGPFAQGKAAAVMGM